jgi:hypothetical protein
MPTRPTTPAAWATSTTYPAGSLDWSGQNCKVQPSVGKQAQGITPNTDQPAEEFNWLWNLICLWIQWFLTIPTTASDAPQYVYQDASSNTREVFDHNGYRSGRTTEFRESWFFSTSITAAGSTAYPHSNGPWNASISGTHSTVATLAGGGGPIVGDSPVMQLVISGSGVTNDSAGFGGKQALFQPQTYVSAVLEFEITLATAGANNMTVTAGWNTSPGAASVTSFAQFMKRSTDINWQASTDGGGGSPTIVDTGVVALASSLIFCRVEVHGSASPYGQCCRFFLNGTLVATITTTQPQTATNPMSPCFAIVATGNAGNTLTVSPLLAIWNRSVLSLPSV